MMRPIMNTDMTLIDAEWPYGKAKTAVLMAAAHVLRELGPRSATLKNIANRAGITEPAIFRHFNGVDGLFEGLFSVYERFYGSILEILAAEEPSLDAYFDVLRRVVHFLVSIEDFTYLVFNAEQVFAGYEELKARSLELKKRDEEQSLRFLQVAKDKHEIRSDVAVDTVAFAAMGVIHMTVQTWLAGSCSFDLEGALESRLADVLKLVRA